MSALQAKLTINEPGDRYEQEADRVSEQVMRTQAPDIAHAAPPSIQRLGTGAREELAAKHLQRLCAGCEEDQETEKTLQRRAAPTRGPAGRGQAQPQAEAKVDAVSGGQPLSAAQRAFFEPRFGADFSRVRIHAGSSANAAARAVGALAYTRSHDIVFREGEYQPGTLAGRRLLAHELTHVVQQGAGPARTHPGVAAPGREFSLQRQAAPASRSPLRPPGDCSPLVYSVLRGGVEGAKGMVELLGGCKGTDSCPLLVFKIAAVGGEITARLVMMTICFRGGDEGHWKQIDQKMIMLDKCFDRVRRAKCGEKLLQKIMEVVKLIAKVIAVIAIIALAVVALFLLIEALIVLVAMIVEALAILAAVGATALIVILQQLLQSLSPAMGEADDEQPPTRLKT